MASKRPSTAPPAVTTYERAKVQAEQARALSLPKETGAVGFWRSTLTDEHLFTVNANCDASSAQGLAETLLCCVRDRIDQSVAGDIPDDGVDSSITGNEAFMLGFVMHAAVALVQSLPTESRPLAASATEGTHHG